MREIAILPITNPGFHISTDEFAVKFCAPG
jgi:hypothetical protein